MANLLEASGKEFFLANEDWIGDPSSKTRINGGLLFAKNTEFTRNLFEDMLDAHWSGPQNKERPRIGGSVMRGCSSNEQLCLDSIRNRPNFMSKSMMESRSRWNCGPNDKTMQQFRKSDPKLEVMHFMGG